MDGGVEGEASESSGGLSAAAALAAAKQHRAMWSLGGGSSSLVGRPRSSMGIGGEQRDVISVDMCSAEEQTAMDVSCVAITFCCFGSPLFSLFW